MRLRSRPVELNMAFCMGAEPQQRSGDALRPRRRPPQLSLWGRQSRAGAVLPARPGPALPAAAPRREGPFPPLPRAVREVMLP